MAANVELAPRALKDLEKLREPILTRVIGILERLADWPDVSGAKPLRGPLAGNYRIRTGHYRVQFHVADSKVVVDRIGHRDGFYED